MFLFCIISKFHNNFILKLGKKAKAPDSVLQIAQSVGLDGLSIYCACSWVQPTDQKC